jgi:c-di-GMP-binding flagellar brake protein YcgR
MKDKRKEERVLGEDKVVMNLVSGDPVPGAKAAYYSLTRDISPGGVRLVTDAPVPVDSDVRLEIALSKVRKLVRATGKVRWVGLLYGDGVYELGIEFTDIGPESIGAILEYVYKREIV